MEMSEDIAAAVSKAVALLLDPMAPHDERRRLARDLLDRVFPEYEEWATGRAQRRSGDAARQLRIEQGDF